jgi:hypothetical protein
MKFTNQKNIDIENLVTIPVHIAKTGKFKGYSDGEFELTSETFSSLIDNFNSEKNPLPVYRGHADVQGSVTGEEPRACGWILSLSKEKTSSNEEGLFALVGFNQEMAEQIKAGEYKFSSIYMRMNETDRVSGDEIGPRLCSLAITNQPFIDGLKEIKLSMINHKEGYIYLSNQMENDISQEERSKTMEKDETEQKEESTTETEQAAKEEEKIVEASMDMMETLRGEFYPDMSPEDFAMFLKDVLSQMKSSDEEVQASETEEKTEEEKTEEEKVVEASEVAASNKGLTLSALTLKLSTLQKENKELQIKLSNFEQKENENLVDSAIKTKRISKDEKEFYLSWMKRDKKHAEESLALRKPQVVLGRIMVDSVKDTANKTANSSNEKSLTEKEKKILSNMGIKID